MRTIKHADLSGLLEAYLEAVEDDKLELALRISPLAHGHLPEPNVVLIFDDGHRTELRVEPKESTRGHDAKRVATSNVTDIYLQIARMLKLQQLKPIMATYDQAIESGQNGWVVLTTEGSRDFIAEYRPKI